MGRLKNEEKPEEEKEDLFRHFSHEHPLELSCNTSETGQIICVGCGIHVLPGKAYYACRTCRFSLHSACYNMPRKVHHPADPGHDLILLLMPSFACKACGKPGSGFAYNCRICLQSYHSLCSVFPLSTSHYSHPHILNIEFSPPYDGVKGFRCDVCRNLGYDHWLYRCGPCGFDVHLNCALSNQPPQPQMVSSDNRFNHRSIPSNGVQPNQNVTFVPANVQGTNQVVYVQANGMAPMAPPQAYPGYYYGNQMAVNGQNQGGMNGMKGLLVGSVASGMGQAVAQEIVHSVTSGWGNGSGSSGNGDSDIASSWVGGGAIIASVFARKLKVSPHRVSPLLFPFHSASTTKRFLTTAVKLVGFFLPRVGQRTLGIHYFPPLYIAFYFELFVLSCLGCGVSSTL